MGDTYCRKGDYLLTGLTLPETAPAGIWGQRRRRYLKTQRGSLYKALLLSGMLVDLLVEIDTHAEAMFSQLVEQLTEQEGITEQLKTENQMEWVDRMNNIRNQAWEIIYKGLIYC